MSFFCVKLEDVGELKERDILHFITFKREGPEYQKHCQRSHVTQDDSHLDTVWFSFSLVLVLRKCGRRHPSVSQSVCSDVRWVHGAVWVGLPIIHPGSSNIVYNRYIGTTRCLLLQ